MWPDLEIQAKHLTYTNILSTFSRLTSSHWKSTIDSWRRSRQADRMRKKTTRNGRKEERTERQSFIIANKETRRTSAKSDSLWHILHLWLSWERKMNGSAANSLGIFFFVCKKIYKRKLSHCSRREKSQTRTKPFTNEWRRRRENNFLFSRMHIFEEFKAKRGNV